MKNPAAGAKYTSTSYMTRAEWRRKGNGANVLVFHKRGQDCSGTSATQAFIKISRSSLGCWRAMGSASAPRSGGRTSWNEEEIRKGA